LQPFFSRVVDDVFEVLGNPVIDPVCAALAANRSRTFLTTTTPNSKSAVNVVVPVFFVSAQRGHNFFDFFLFTSFCSSCRECTMILAKPKRDRVFVIAFRARET